MKLTSGFRAVAAVGALSMVLLTNSFAKAADPFVGDWALTLPGGAAGWLGVEEAGGKRSAQIMWGVGSVLPVDRVAREGDKLVLTRGQGEGNAETITATVNGDEMKLTIVKKLRDGSESEKESFTGKRQPPLPQAPDLSKVKFGKPIQLFNGKDLTGWRLTDPHADNGWRAVDGLLVNDTSHPAPHRHFGNLRTDREFEDFNLKLETKLDPEGNSGVYIRGIYECQVADTYGRPPDPHNMGAIYSRIKPTKAAEKPPGEWQTLDITFVDRHVTVILNGQKIIDNQPIRGCTGGALWSDVTRPGPIYLQGDHTGITYRNIVLRPVVK